MNSRHDFGPRILCLVALVVISGTALTPARAGDRAFATLAAGCFWCIEADLEKIEGVVSVTSGYTGGSKKNPTYNEVSAGETGHTEAVRVVFDTAVLSFEQLLAVFWHNVDPTTADRQFCDVGTQYRSGIFFHDEEQHQAALRSRVRLDETKPFAEPIVTEITAASAFYPAEAYHQDYYKKNPIRYAYYRRSCGRDRRLEELWGDKK